MTHQLPQPTADDRAAVEALLHEAAQDVKRQAQQSTAGRADQFRQLAAEFAHLGAVADDLLGLALADVERTPDYFAALTRLGLTEALQSSDPPEPPPEVIAGTATKTQSEGDDDGG